ncbi:MAG TPA: hypothetical protein VIH95_10285 [Acidimicrobiales bacterium]
MIALSVVLSAVVLLLAVLVAGLLRSHADILKALHDLGAGVGDPAGGTLTATSSATSAGGDSFPLTMGPTLAPDRDSISAPPVAGVTPGGDAQAVAPATDGALTLLAFLSTGCASCAGFWDAFRQPERLGLPAGTRLVVVTKGPEREIPGEVAALAAPGLVVVMSSDAWTDYEVPGSPFFVLVDGTAGCRVGEGVANHFSQVAELVRRAEVDAAAFTLGRRAGRDVGIDGPARESANDRELLDAGIRPGDPSLYPTSLEDLYGPPDARMPVAPRHVRRAG